MKNKIYTVQAFRWGEYDNHSYIVGVYTKKHKALTEATKHEESRGNKYECKVEEWDYNSQESKVIKDLGEIQ